jgi:transposase
VSLSHSLAHFKPGTPISKSPLRGFRGGTTIGIDLGDVWSHYCTINEEGAVIDRGRFRTNPSGVDKRFRDLGPIRIAMEAGTPSGSASRYAIWAMK